MNSITLTGRLTADPELRTTHSGAAVGQMRVAVARRRGKQGADRGAVFVDVVTFGALAESCGTFPGSGCAFVTKMQGIGKPKKRRRMRSRSASSREPRYEISVSPST